MKDDPRILGIAFARDHLSGMSSLSDEAKTQAVLELAVLEAAVVAQARKRRHRSMWDGNCLNTGGHVIDDRECEAPELCWPANCCFRDGTDAPLVETKLKPIVMVRGTSTQ